VKFSKLVCVVKYKKNKLSACAVECQYLLTLLTTIFNKQISTTYADLQIKSLQIFQNVGNV